jgi:hypothetical protein
MYPYYYRLLHGLPCPSLHSLGVHGSPDRSSNESERPRDTERDILALQLSTDEWILAKQGGDSGEWIRAAETVEIEDAR